MRRGFFFFFKQKTAYEMLRSLVGSEMCIRDRYQRRVRGTATMQHGPIPPHYSASLAPGPHLGCYLPASSPLLPRAQVQHRREWEMQHLRLLQGVPYHAVPVSGISAIQRAGQPSMLKIDLDKLERFGHCQLWRRRTLVLGETALCCYEPGPALEPEYMHSGMPLSAIKQVRSMGALEFHVLTTEGTMQLRTDHKNLKDAVEFFVQALRDRIKIVVSEGSREDPEEPK
eukprot:TRINITY_DN24007_c0_g1_i3.p1 TRINITY_DN24007_c0_g1~~TRINITY_DN24007_c0_g1_i3.p1  ORF type:complete len:228 (-),score=59.20 TRINITY_DN24007_c0_g1_i3:403-1086(-)